MTSSSPRAGAFGDELTNLALGTLIGAMLLAGALRLAGSIAAFVTGAPQPAAGLEAGVGVVFRADDPGSALGSASLSPVAYWITVALLLAAIGTADPAIDFQASDGKAVNLVVLLVSPTRNTTLHVQALGAISRRLGHAEIRRRLRNCPDAGCVYDVLCRAD